MTRASIDPLSNVIRPRRLDLRTGIKGFLSPPWPQEHAQSFLHEMTHHWCFRSPFGTALALVRGQALGLVFRDDDDPPTDEERPDLFDGLAGVDAVLRFLRPLLEGLALFAEYDMLPGRSSYVSSPMVWACLMFAPGAAMLDISDPAQALTLADALTNMRLSRGSLRHKMGFLSKPLSPLDHAYVDGYLVVKRIYFDLLQQSDLLEDTDLFLGYLRAYLFEDAGLLAILYRDEEFLNQRFVQVLERFRQRLRRLREGDFADDIAAFHDGLNRPFGFQYDFAVPGLKVTEKEIDEARRGHARMMARLEDDPSLPPLRRNFLNIQRGWLSRRAIATVLSEPVLVEINPSAVTIWPDPPDGNHFLAIMPTTIDHQLPVSPDPLQGWYSLVAFPQIPTIAVIAGVGETLVAVHWFSGTGEPEPGLTDWLRDPLHSPPHIEREARDLGAYLDDFFQNAPPPLRELHRAWHAAVDEEWDHHRRAFMQRWSSPPSNSAADTIMQPGRVREIYNRDASLFETSVALSVLRSVDVLMPSLQAELLSFGWDVQAALRRAIDVQRETGVMLIRNNHGSIEWTI